MPDPEVPRSANPIADAIRAKREGPSHPDRDWDALAADLVRDIESFDLDLASRQAGEEGPRRAPAEGMVFPEILPEGVERVPVTTPPAPAPAAPARATDSPLLGELRREARERQAEFSQELMQRTHANEVVDRCLRQVFLYFHEFVQQLNILRPAVACRYEVGSSLALQDLAWQEGFADYRTQSQSAGALVELVTFSYQLAGSHGLRTERQGPAIERFRQQLFDYGLHFRQNEVRDARRQVVQAEFEIDAALGVSTRWRADYSRGLVVVESRNLERLGNQIYTLAPEAIGPESLDEFGRLVLGQPSRFRSFCKR